MGGGESCARDMHSHKEQDLEVNGAVAQGAHHYWLDDLFPDGVPADVRLKYLGLHLSGRWRGEPLLLAEVDGEDATGARVCWIARRCRKRVLQPHQCSPPPPPISWLGALNARLLASKPGWWVALLFVLGSLLFLVSGVGRVVPAVALPETDPPGLGSLYAVLTAWMESIACNLFFTPGCFLQVLEATNMDWNCRQRAWEKGGRRGRRPQPRLLPSRDCLRTVSWWATAIQMAGILGFDLSTTTDVVGSGVSLGPNVVTWCMKFAFTFGGAAFTVGSWLACWEETGSWWRGLVLTRWEDLHSISWLAVFFSFWGSVGFMVNGALLFAYSKLSWRAWTWVIGTCHIAASVFFLLSAGLGLLEQANPGHL